MRELLQLHLHDKQYKDMLARYHFGEHNLEQLRQIGNLVEEAAEPVMYYEVFVQDEAKGNGSGGESTSERLAVIVTLGGDVDELQERYVQRERLTESYMIECIGMELLKAAYEQAAERIYAHTGKWMSGFEFVGERVPLDNIEVIFRRLAPQEVSYNRAYMLTPKKSVVFLTDLCDERKDSYCHVCADCTYLTCPNRRGADTVPKLNDNHKTMESDSGHGAETKQNLTYGYQRIFGEKG